MTAERQKQIESMAEKAFPLPPIEGWQPDFDVWKSDREKYTKGASEVLDAVDWDQLKLFQWLLDNTGETFKIPDLIEYLKNNIILNPKP